MVPNEFGKYCSSCNKSVIDIRNKSNSELDFFIRTNSISELCIRANKSQIKDYQYVKPIKRLAFALLIVFGNTLFSLSASAQEATQKLRENYLKQNIRKSYASLIGTIKDSHGEPLPLAMISVIKDQKLLYKDTTDFDGNYRVDVDESYANKKLTIEVSYIGYNSESKIILIKNENIETNFTLGHDMEIMGDIMIIEEPKVITVEEK